MAANGSLWVRLAAISGLVSVAAGAFAAHSVKDPGARELLRTGASYEATHALAALAAVVLDRQGGRGSGLAPALFLGGAVLFSGSLYALALGAPRVTGAITPIGGLAFIAGWAVFALQAGGAGGARRRRG
ncbi:MAG TPA: DUF423 domain-containing protein [Caulobacteraceae bacterium]|jgi:uncharacterized membrane protein YgdD (TMEM256/DUF423 family)|nr:DUF423 domain-containing protein [Caulobacteraceae bacterium]